MARTMWRVQSRYVAQIRLASTVTGMELAAKTSREGGPLSARWPLVTPNPGGSRFGREGDA
jgi:hypothetical protein